MSGSGAVAPSPDTPFQGSPTQGPGAGKEMGSRRPSITRLPHQGTTGRPKGATLSHYNIVNNSNLIGERLRMHLKVRGLAQALLGGRGWGAPPAG